MKKWYDKIASFYDIFTENFYKFKRLHLYNNLGIKKGDKILIIACGTGQSFDILQKFIGKDGKILAMDYSDKMLEIAEKRIINNNWRNIELIKQDVKELSKLLNKKGKFKEYFDVLLLELAVTVVPDWENVLKASLDFLKDKAKIGIMDWYGKKENFLTKIINFLADAHTSRDTIKVARMILSDFRIIRRYFFKEVFLYSAIGSK